MDLGTVLSVAQTLFAALQCAELKEFCSMLGYKSELEKLERTVKIVKAVLEEAESKELPPQAQLYVDQLKDVVFDADDLLDEFVTLAQRKKQLIKEGKASEKLGHLFSRFNPLATAYKMSQGVKEIRKRLDEIAGEHTKFGFKLDNKPILRRREETCSYVDVKGIIGRDDDVEEIVGRLLDLDHVHRDVSGLAIVGLGGLGKTALAQVVFNDARVVKDFDLRVWTCVSDQDQKTLDVKRVLSSIFHSLTEGKHRKLALEPLLKQLRDQLVGKRWLIVLDDVWSEDRRTLLDLTNKLMIGLRGSWIMVTTRSEKTATMLGNEYVHKLKGLSIVDSYLLFRMTAFEEVHEIDSILDFVPIGFDIVKRCAYVPLAIKVVGSLLYGQPKEKWISFQKKGLGRLKYGDNGGIEPILKLSYHQLDSPLKACFAYCALFPKDFVIKKDLLLNLWMAQDYVVPEEGQSTLEASEEYFSILVRRCFFQDITKDECGEITSCKIHDLMHDMVQEIAGKEIYATNCFATNLCTKIRHLSYNFADEDVQGLLPHSKIRTCLRIEIGPKSLPVDELLRNWTCLRALDLRESGIKSLPSSLGKLVHLRYLDLSFNLELEMLSNSITKLHNLQTLILQGCLRLKELPKDLSKLVQLQVLDIGIHCHDLNGMPQGIGKLTCLQKLPLFVVVDDDSTLNQTLADQIEGLKALTRLKGSLEIKIINDMEYIPKNVGYIRNMELLSNVTFDLHRDWTEGSLIEDLQPHPKVKKLELVGYKGRRMPSWAVEGNLAVSLPNLVHLCLWSCRRLKDLPSLRKMCHLKSLRLCYLDDLEYIENTTASSSGDVGNNDPGSSELEMLYPSLGKVELSNMPNLRGWWREEGQHTTLPSFPCLSKLQIAGCDSLTCIPPCPALEELELKGELNKNLRIQIATESGYPSKLRYVQTSNIGLSHIKFANADFSGFGIY